MTAAQTSRRVALQILSAAPFCGASAAVARTVVPDVGLVAAIEEHHGAMAIWRGLLAAREPFTAQFEVEKPERPATLRFNGGDGLDVGFECERISETKSRAWYGGRQVFELRKQSPRILGRSVFDDRRDKRRDEIIAAYDAWHAERDALMERIGLTAADAECDAGADRLADIEVRIMNLPPRSLAGLAAKARWLKDTCDVELVADQIIEDIFALAGEVA